MDDNVSNPNPATPANPTVVDTLGNDTDPQGDINISTVNLTDPAATDEDGDGDADKLVVPGEGTWTVDDATGEVTFTPEAGFTADPTPIKYTVKDDTNLESNEATVTVDYPNAVVGTDDNATGTPTQPETVNVLGNDTGDNPLDPTTVNLDPASVPGSTGTDTDGDGDIDEVVVPGEGTWTANPDGTVTFTPEPGFVGDPTPIDYTVKDDEGTESAPATITIDYTQDASITVEKTGVFSDENANGYADVGETIIYSFIVTNTGDVPLTNVSITDVNATITGGPIDLAIGESDTTTFVGVHSITIDDIIAGAIHNQATVTAKDPNGNDVNDTSDDPTTSPNDDPTIVNVSPKPPVSTDDNQTVTTGEDAVIDIIDNDGVGTFPLDPQSVTLTEPSNATNIVTDSDGDTIGFTVPGEGTWSVNPITGQVTFSPEDGFVGDPTPVEYTVEDSQGNTTSAMINLNYPPVANDDSNTSLPVGETATLTPLENDQETSTPFDPESIDLVVPNGATGSDTDGDGDIDEIVVSGEGTWTANPDGTVTFVPENGLVGNPTPLNYTVKETGGDVSNEATLSVTYVSGSSVPNAVDDGIINITHYGATVIDVLVNDDFGTDGPNQGEIVITSQPTHGTVSLDNHGTPNDPTDDVFIFEPEPNVPQLTDSFTYTITDANGDTSTATVTLDINCASTQTSDSGDALGIISMLMMIFMTIMTGLYLVRKEEKIREEV